LRLLTPLAWHIAMPSGEGGNHPIYRNSSLNETEAHAVEHEVKTSVLTLGNVPRALRPVTRGD
jgi:hypothetical protein